MNADRRRFPAAALQTEPTGTDRPRRSVAADLGIGREANAAIDALLAQRLGLAAYLCWVDVLEQLVERGLVVPRVVNHADRGLMPLGERRDEVLAPQLQR